MTATATAAASTAAPRLGNGELRGMVAEVLAGDPAAEFGPRDVAKILGRSSGAVGNALKTLAAAGLAEQCGDKPLRFRATADTATAAAGTPTPSAAPAPAAGTPRRRRPAPKPAPATAPKSAPAAVTAPAPAPKGSVAAAATRRNAPGGTAVVATAATRAPRRRGPAAPAPAPVPAAPEVRPGGQEYRVRELGGRADVDVLAAMREAGLAVLLYGPRGAGKSELVQAAHGEVVTVHGGGGLTVAQVVGEAVPDPDGTVVFAEGPLVRAMREGAVLFVDDVAGLSAAVLEVVVAAMEGRREIVVHGNGGEVVKAAPGFAVVAGLNATVLPEALAARFALRVAVGSDDELAEALGADPGVVRVARALAARRDAGEAGWVPPLRELMNFAVIAAATDTATAAANLIGAAPVAERALVAEVVGSVFGTGGAVLALGGCL
ncbi:AAA family ATPase [Nocardia cyriacigeorgica]|uniref:AAA family ATPase n=1 Tax=Nocardia cyriacigeorgica TaxID=135487 RepID=UPI001E5E0D31|nr:AAA family ATPase [Nocardia cyriacigeorgica]